MSTVIYLLRSPAGEMSSALYAADALHKTVVCIERAASGIGEILVSDDPRWAPGQSLSYETLFELVEQGGKVITL